MSFVLADRIKELSSTTGTGNVTLSGASTGYQTFAAGIGAGNSTYYVISHQTLDEWEVGIGTVLSGPSRLQRDTVLAGSNGTSLVNFGSGLKDVFVGAPATKTMLLDPIANVLYVSGGLSVTGSVASTANITAVSGVFAYVTGTLAGLISNAISASYATTASYAANGGGAADWNTLANKPTGIISSSGGYYSVTGTISTTGDLLSGNNSNIGSSTGSTLTIVVANTGRWRFNTGSLFPITDNSVLFGLPTNRPLRIYAVSGAFNHISGTFEGNINNATTASYALTASHLSGITNIIYTVGINAPGIFSGRGAETMYPPTQSTRNASQLARFEGQGYDEAGYYVGAYVQVVANENWTGSTNRGTSLQFTAQPPNRGTNSKTFYHYGDYIIPSVNGYINIGEKSLNLGFGDIYATGTMYAGTFSGSGAQIFGTPTASYATKANVAPIAIPLNTSPTQMIVSAFPLAITEHVQEQRTLYDLTGYTQVRLVANVISGSAVTTSSVAVEYSTNQNTWSSMSLNAQPSATLFTSGVIDSGWKTLIAGAQGTVFLRWVTQGGNGGATAKLGSIIVYSK